MKKGTNRFSGVGKLSFSSYTVVNSPKGILPTFLLFSKGGRVRYWCGNSTNQIYKEFQEFYKNGGNFVNSLQKEYSTHWLRSDDFFVLWGCHTRNNNPLQYLDGAIFGLFNGWILPLDVILVSVSLSWMQLSFEMIFFLQVLNFLVDSSNQHILLQLQVYGTVSVSLLSTSFWSVF